MFEDLKKEELAVIFQDYTLSHNDGRMCESLVPFAEEYRRTSGMNDLLPLYVALEIVCKDFFEEVAKRYFEYDN